jgi:hypothetical protein
MAIRTDLAHPARVYDYWLGGKDNFAADRELAQRQLQVVPHLRTYARGNRQFLVRAVRFACEAGVRQFLDIGAGLPSSPNVHEIARQSDPGSRVVYVDNDPVVFLHAEALMAKGGTTAVARADMRDVDDVLEQAGKLIDFRAPAALMFVASLQHLDDDDDPVGLVARYLDAMAPGSYLILSHITPVFALEGAGTGKAQAREQAIAQARDAGIVVVPRGKDAILRMFNGRELLDPGLVLVSRWRPENGEPGLNADNVMAYGGVAAL